jgi:hypothetical protein
MNGLTFTSAFDASTDTPAQLANLQARAEPHAAASQRLAQTKLRHHPVTHQ